MGVVQGWARKRGWRRRTAPREGCRGRAWAGAANGCAGVWPSRQSGDAAARDRSAGSPCKGRITNGNDGIAERGAGGAGRACGAKSEHRAAARRRSVTRYGHVREGARASAPGTNTRKGQRSAERAGRAGPEPGLVLALLAARVASWLGNRGYGEPPYGMGRPCPRFCPTCAALRLALD